MAHTIKVLFIDDNNISDEITSIRRPLSKGGINLECKIINIKDGRFQDLKHVGGERKQYLSKEKIRNYIDEKGYMDERFDIVACDFNFSDDHYNGYHLLTSIVNTARSTNKRIQHAKFLFYSGNTTELERIAGSDVKKLLPLKIEGIVARERLPETILRIITKMRREIDLTEKFVKLLDLHAEKKFKSTYTDFRGVTLGSISTEIQQSTERANKFLDVLVDQTISHLILLQED